MDAKAEPNIDEVQPVTAATNPAMEEEDPERVEEKPEPAVYENVQRIMDTSIPMDNFETYVKQIFGKKDGFQEQFLVRISRYANVIATKSHSCYIFKLSYSQLDKHKMMNSKQSSHF